MNNQDKFLEELTKLTKKYKIGISALGVTPFLYHEFSDGKYTSDEDGDYLTWEKSNG